MNNGRLSRHFKIFSISPDVQSEKVRAEWAEIAKKELDDWYRHRNEQLEKTKVSNR